VEIYRQSRGSGNLRLNSLNRISVGQGLKAAESN